MVVVAAVEGVEVEGAFALQELAVGHDRAAVSGDHVAVVAAEHVDVGGHVHEVAGVGDEVAQLVGGPQRPLREGRHLHRVHVHVQQAGVGAIAVRAGHPALEHRHRLGRVGALGGLAGLQVPELPGRAADQRLGAQRGDVAVVAELCVDLAHGGRVLVVPGGAVLGRRVLREARPQRSDQRPLDRRAGAGQLVGAGDGAVSGGHGVDQLLPLEGLPVFVVVGADRVGEAPVRHRAGGVGLDRVLEAADGLLVVEGVAPGEAAVEPGLGVVRRGGDGAAESAEVVVVVAEHGEGPIIRSARV